MTNATDASLAGSSLDDAKRLNTRELARRTPGTSPCEEHVPVCSVRLKAIGAPGCTRVQREVESDRVYCESCFMCQSDSGKREIAHK